MRVPARPAMTALLISFVVGPAMIRKLTTYKIGQAVLNSYTDTSFTAAGTYYYLVTAQDAKGNVSTPSNEATATVTLDTLPPTVSIAGT